MHDYLRAVGFSKLTQKKEIQCLLDMVMGSPEYEYVGRDGRMTMIGERCRDFAKDAGITVRGEYDENGVFNYDYFFPHYKGSQNSFTEDMTVEKLAEREEYDGVCDMISLGVTLIFHMNHMEDYQNGKGIRYQIPRASVNLSALSVSGTVLIPMIRTESQKIYNRRETEARNGMLAAARDGDQEAIEQLTIKEMDLYSSLAKRVQTEDILSIVESYFMPYGISCDQYSVLGDILECEEVYNQVTGEKLWQLVIECNDMIIALCINAQDLLGEPEPGRRFRGNIWLQGQLER